MRQMLLDPEQGYGKQLRHPLVEKIRVDTRSAALRGSAAALENAVSEMKMGAPVGVPRFVSDWRARQESNLRPLASEANTLSTELRARMTRARKSPRKGEVYLTPRSVRSPAAGASWHGAQPSTATRTGRPSKPSRCVKPTADRPRDPSAGCRCCPVPARPAAKRRETRAVRPDARPPPAVGRAIRMPGAPAASAPRRTA